jgi:nitrate/nitrite transporter NarK
VSKLSTKWFGDNERALATTIGSLANPFGCIMGLVLGPIFIPDVDGDKANPLKHFKVHCELNPFAPDCEPDKQPGIDDTCHYMMVAAIIITALCIPLIIFMEEQPPKYPSKASQEMSATKFDFKQEIKELGKNKNFFWISVCFMLMYGLYTTIGAIINTMVSPYGYTGSDSGIFGACFILCGLVGSFMQGALLDKYGKYLLLLKGICFGVFFFFLGFFYTLQDKGEGNWNMILLTINVSVIGFLLLPIIPLGYGFSIELTYPVSEAMSNGVLMLWSQMAGSLLTFVGSWICEQNKRSILYLFIA